MYPKRGRGSGSDSSDDYVYNEGDSDSEDEDPRRRLYIASFTKKAAGTKPAKKKRKTQVFIDLDGDDSEDGSSLSIDEEAEQNFVTTSESKAPKEAEGAIADTQGRDRNRLPSAAYIHSLRYFAAPDYEGFDDNQRGWCRGGKKATAVLGPAALIEVNSDAKGEDSLPALGPVKDKYPNTTFKPGHLLNAMFGGVAVEANLTVLTTATNNSMNAFDNHVKNAMNHLKNFYFKLNEMRIDASNLTYGIEVVVTVNDATWGSTHPNDLVATGLVCTAVPVDVPDVQQLVDDAFPDGRGAPDLLDAKQDEAEKLIADVLDETTKATDNGDLSNVKPS